METQTNQETSSNSSQFIKNSIIAIKDFRWWTKIIAVANIINLSFNTGLLLFVIANYSLESITSYVFAICLKGGIIYINLMLRRATITNNKVVIKLWLYTYGFIFGTEIAIFLNRIQYNAELLAFGHQRRLGTRNITDQYLMFNVQCLNILWNIISVCFVYTFKETIKSGQECIWRQ